MNNTNNVSIPYLEMGGGFLLGMSVGYALKKSFKALLLLFGLGFIFMILLESQGAISIDQMPLQDVINLGADKFKSAFELLQQRFEKYQVAGGMSALAGFMVGIKIA